MGGRTIETTNCWDPAENSVAQTTFESTSKDVFKFYRRPPVELKYTVKADRVKIHQYVYEGSWWVNLASIEAEASELLQSDPAQAERFFGNRMVHGLGTWLPDDLFESRKAPREIEPGTPLALGFDGSESGDWTAIRLSTEDGYRFTPTYGPDALPTYWDPVKSGGQIPRGEVDAAIDELCTRYRIVRANCDPRDWQSEIGDWALRYGDDVFVEWATYRITPMHAALNRVVSDLVSGRTTHDGCEMTTRHVGNARKIAKPGQKYILGKPTDHQKIDLAMADALASEAAAEAREAGLFAAKTEYVYVR